MDINNLASASPWIACDVTGEARWELPCQMFTGAATVYAVARRRPLCGE